MNILKVNHAPRVIAIVAVAGLLAGVMGYQVVQARNTSVYFDEVVESSDAMDNVVVRLEVGAETTATSTLLVDRDDTTNWPHDLVGANGIEVSQIKFDWLANGAATTSVKVGVVASTSRSGAESDVYWFDEVSFSTNAPTYTGRQSRTLSYAPSTVKLFLSGGAPSKFLTNDSLLANHSYATTTPLLSPNGYTEPEVGDLVMQIEKQEGTATTSVQAIYRTR